MLIEILTLIYVLCITIPIVFWVFMSRDDSIFMTPYERMIKYESNYMRRIIPDDIMITTKWVESDYSNTRVMIFKRQYDNTCKSAIVLVHGGSSTSINAFGTMIKHLIDHYDIYTIDLPGYGISHITDNILPIESAPFLRIYTDILADVYRYLNLHDYSIVAHSFGCFYMHHMLANNPDIKPNKMINITPFNILPHVGRYSYLLSLYYNNMNIHAIQRDYRHNIYPFMEINENQGSIL